MRDYIITAITVFSNILVWALIIQAFSTWVVPYPRRNQSPLRYLDAFIDPILIPARKILQSVPGVKDLPIDFSPIVALLLIQVLQVSLVYATLYLFSL